MVIVAAFVSSTLLVPHAFERLRPPERERAEPEPQAQLEVEARLWEDPFIAARRYEADREKRCAEAGKAKTRAVATKAAASLDGKPECDVPSREPGAWRDGLLRNDVPSPDARTHGLADTLVIAVLAPGHPFVGAEESRRRTRYALLAGLQAKDYVPSHPERMGLLALKMTAPSQKQQRTLLVPYELLVPRPQMRGDQGRVAAQAYRKVAVLWINETALQTPKLDSLVRLLGEAVGKDAVEGKAAALRSRVVVIGPSSSDALRTALKDLRAAAEGQAAKEAAALPTARKAAGKPDPNDAAPYYRLLADAEILSPFATASNRQMQELNGQRLEQFIGERLNMFRPALARDDSVGFQRLIAPDSEVLSRLVGEIELRLPRQARRVVLVAERDSLYSQALVAELSHHLKNKANVTLEVRYFFRGLDGTTTRDTESEETPLRKKKDGGDGKDDEAAPVEWPEGRDQLDYLRRLAGWLKDSEAAGPPASRASGTGPQPRADAIGAIGILGSDVHDKLLVLQALRDSFSDKVFFTTDMDARYLHPKALPFSRNLLVASSLPLQMPASVQRGTPAFRDVYQTATYLAARRAACREDSCKRDEDDIATAAIREPSVYEIGRTHAVPLAGYDFTNARASSRHTRALVAALFVMLLVGALIAWPSTPALRRTRDELFGGQEGPGADDPPLALPVVLLVALHMALQVYAIGSAVELTQPRLLGFNSILFMCAVTAFATLLGLYALSNTPARQPVTDQGGSGRYNAALSALLVFVLAGGFLWMAWPSGNGAACADCEPVFWFEGVSAWPSHLIHVLVLLAIVCALDHAWYSAHRSPSDLCGSVYSAAVNEPDDDGRWARVKHWFGHSTLAGWRPAMVEPQQKDSGNTVVCCSRVDQKLMSVNADLLGREYLQRARTSARMGRVLFWYVITVALMALLFFGLSEGYVPEVPVRGEDHRRLVTYTLYAVLLLLPLLVVVVADDTMLACRFIWHMSRGRSLYCHHAIEHYARMLGGEHAVLWTRGIFLRPSDRAEQEAMPEDYHHTLLDDWIDIQVVAQVTRRVAPLIIWPFVVLALLIVARSRLFDNWALTMPIALGAAAYLMWLVVLAVALKQSSEQIRHRSLLRMKEDLRWLQGSSGEWPKLVEPFKELIAAVESNRTGAFANLFDQPLFKALLVPLGTAGGAHWIEWLLLGRG